MRGTALGNSAVALWARQHERQLRCVAIPLGVLAYMALWFASGLTLSITTDLDAFFLPAARIALGGHPWQVYTVTYLVQYPNANGPLSLLPLTGLAAIAQHLGWLGSMTLRRGLILAGFAPFLLLLAYEIARAVDRVRGAPLRGWARLGLYAMVLFAPTNWISLLFYGHIEQPLMLWLALVGTRMLVERRAGRAGVVFGLAILTRSAAMLFPLALIIVLLRWRRMRAIVLLDGACAVTVALGLLPFLLADSRHTLWSLVGFRDQLPVGGGNLWGIIANAALENFAQRWDSAVTIGIAMLVCIVVLVARGDFSLKSAGLYDLFGAVGLCFPLFIKTLWPYYFFEPWMYAVLWWFAWRTHSGRGRIVWSVGALVPIVVLIGGAVSDQWRSQYFGPGDGLWWNAVVAGTLLVELVILVVSATARRVPAGERAEGRMSEAPLSTLPLAPSIEH